MKGYVDASLGRAILELGAEELRTLYAAVKREVADRVALTMDYDQAADGREALAEREPRGRVANRRIAGELRTKAAAHRSLAKDAGDLLRVLQQLTTDPDVR